jgi:hypothetical protein
MFYVPARRLQRGRLRIVRLPVRGKAFVGVRAMPGQAVGESES